MPKTPACSPLKRGPSQRFPPSLLISYVESPTQQSYVIAAEEASDSDNADGESEDIIDDTKREYEDVHITPKAPEVTLMRISDAEGNGSGATTNPKNPAASTGYSKVTVASRFQSARQVLADARHRSFQLGERSLSATFQHMRSYSSSSVRCQGTTDNSSSSNDTALESPISSNQAKEQQQDQTDPEPRHQRPKYDFIRNGSLVASDNQEQEDREPEPQRPQQQQMRKKRSPSPRVRAVSYQSALAKYLPIMFSRTKLSTKASTTTNANDGGCDNNNSNGNQLGGASDNASACDSDRANARRKAKSISSTTVHVRAKRFPKWMRRHSQQSEEQNESRDNQREHEGDDDEDSLRAATRMGSEQQLQ